MLVDYHIHSKFSSDCTADLVSIAENAIRNGMDEIAITDHFEINSSWGSEYNQDEFFEEIEQLRKAYDGRLIVRSGIEIGNVFLWPDKADEVLKYPYDYVLASVHDVDDRDLMIIDYANTDLHELITKYLADIEATIEWGGFDCLAHFDLPARYCSMQGVSLDWDEFDAEIESILKKLLKYDNKGIELNVSAWRMGYEGFYDSMPSENIMRMWQRLGGEIVTVGTDSHSAENAGKCAREGQEFLLKCGFREIATFEQRRPKMHKIN